MALLDVYNISRERVSQVEVPDEIFDAELKEHLFYDVIRMQMANRRSGNSSTKQRGEVRGGGKKPWKQKGTGRARAGSTRSPLWRGGGIIFGPKPRDYSYDVPKKVKKLALCSALTLKRKNEKLLILDKIEIQEIKTRIVMRMLNELGVKRALIIEEGNSNLRLSARNLPEVKVLSPEGLNLYDLLNYDDLFITQNCLEKIQRRLVA
ncbi:MAG: 50S ribosomal protein L4 [Pseudomonadota bacterium]